MITSLNYYTNAYTPLIADTITNQTWLSLIQDSSYISKIEEARQYKALYTLTNNSVIKAEYDKIKKTLPCITWNGLFNTSKSNDNFIQPTGYIYIDIDDAAFNITSLDLTKIYVYHKSVGNMGYSIIVKCEGLSLENYDSTLSFIVNDLGLNQYFDKGAKKLTQYSILSFDKDIYINDDSFIYNSVSSPPISNKNNFVPTAVLVIKKEEHNAAVGTKQNIRYNNLNDFNFNGKDYIENWSEGFDYISINKPFTPLTDGRKRYMMNYIRNYVYLNPGAAYYQILNTAKLINLSIGVEPLPVKFIESQLKTILDQKNKGTLTPKSNKRKILFSTTCLLTRDEKEKIKGERQSLWNNENTTSKLYELIEDWNFNVNGKITIRSVAEILNISKTTVAKYWINVKNYVADLNADATEDIRLYKEHRKNIDKDIQDNNLEAYSEDMTPVTLMEQSMVEVQGTFDTEEDFFTDEELKQLLDSF